MIINLCPSDKQMSTFYSPRSVLSIRLRGQGQITKPQADPRYFRYMVAEYDLQVEVYFFFLFLII